MNSSSISKHFCSSILIIASFFQSHSHSNSEKMRWIRGCLYSAWLVKQIIRRNKKEKIAQNLIILITDDINDGLLQIMDPFV